MNDLTIALLIFLMRIADVSIGTVRTIYTIRGKRGVAMMLGIVESAIWILAIGKAVALMQHNRWAMVGWACGYGAGTFVGITVERWLAAGHILMRVISVGKACELRDALLDDDIGVTLLPGEGRNGEVSVLFVVAPRRRNRELLDRVQKIDPHAFITLDPITTAIGGYMPVAAPASSMRK